MQGGVSTKSILDHSLSSGKQHRTLSPCDSGALAPLPLRACSGVSATTRWSWGEAVAPAAGSLTAPHTPLRRVRDDHLPHCTTGLTEVQLEAAARVVGVTRAVPKQVAVLQAHTCAAIECVWLAPAYASISRDVQGHNSAREGARDARFLSNSVSHMGQSLRTSSSSDVSSSDMQHMWQDDVGGLRHAHRGCACAFVASRPSLGCSSHTN